MDRYEIKFEFIFQDGEQETVWKKMMCVPRENEMLHDFHLDDPVGRNETYDGRIVDVCVTNVEYYRVGKHKDGSHGIKVSGYVQ